MNAISASMEIPLRNPRLWKISRLSAFSSWLCDLIPSFVALGLRPRATHEGTKSHNPSLQADTPYSQIVETDTVSREFPRNVPTFTLRIFVLTQMYRSPSPMLSYAYFGVLRPL